MPAQAQLIVHVMPCLVSWARRSVTGPLPLQLLLASAFSTCTVENEQEQPLHAMDERDMPTVHLTRLKIVSAQCHSSRVSDHQCPLGPLLRVRFAATAQSQTDS
jgi:hypothetical protein